MRATAPPPPPPPQSLVGHAYRLSGAWAHTDVLVYFSHARVSLPPPAWVAAARAHGVPLLGTLITEWADGEAAVELLTRVDGDATAGWPTLCASPGGPAPPATNPLAAALAWLCVRHGFDGWLVNVEAPAPADGAHAATAVAAWLQQLTTAVHAAVPDDRGCVLWYDSLDARTGTVRWASELLPEAHAPFLDACDGIFLDYHWDAARLRRTHAHAAAWPCSSPNSGNGGGTVDRRPDVAVGVDVWGRGMPGGGQWATRGALGAIADAAEQSSSTAAVDTEGGRGRDAGLSVALFGPAWAYEACGGRQGDARLREALESRLWSGAGEALPGHDAGAPVVHNACGRRCPVGAPTSQALDNRAAYLSTALHGWSVVADGGGGGGWAVADCDAGAPGGAGDAGGPGDGSNSPCCFVTSHAWCSALQTVWLPGRAPADSARAAAGPTADPAAAGAHTSSRSPLPASLTVSEWFAGTGPDFGDSYSLAAWLVDEAGRPLEGGAVVAGAGGLPGAPAAVAATDAPPSATPVCFASGPLTCTREWQRAAHTFHRLPAATAGVVLQHSGRDAERWAGHYGARMRGAAVSVPRSPHAADAAGLACGLALPAPPLPPPWRRASAPLGCAASPSTAARALAWAHRAVDSGAALLVPPHALCFAATHGVRPAAGALPLTTHFCDGLGAALYAYGVPLVRRPWTGLGETTLGPSFRDHTARAGLGWLTGLCEPATEAPAPAGSDAACARPLRPRWPHLAGGGGRSGEGAHADSECDSPLSLAVSHHTAWHGGSCLLVWGRLPLAAPPRSPRGPASPLVIAGDAGLTGGAELASGFAAVRLLALAVPIGDVAQPTAHAAAAASTSAPLSSSAMAGDAAPTPPASGAESVHTPLRVRLVYRLEVARGAGHVTDTSSGWEAPGRCDSRGSDGCSDAGAAPAAVGVDSAAPATSSSDGGSPSGPGADAAPAPPPPSPLPVVAAAAAARGALAPPHVALAPLLLLSNGLLLRPTRQGAPSAAAAPPPPVAGAAAGGGVGSGGGGGSGSSPWLTSTAEFDIRGGQGQEEEGGGAEGEEQPLRVVELLLGVCAAAAGGGGGNGDGVAAAEVVLAVGEVFVL